MKTTITAVTVLALVGAALAFPLQSEDSISAWNREFLWGSQRVQLGFGYQKGGNIQAGARLLINDDIPVQAAIGTNINDPKTFKYEVASGLSNQVSGIVAGDSSGEIKYGVRAALPVQLNSGSSQISASVTGDRLKLTSVGAGLWANGENLEAVVGLDNNYTPDGISVSVGANRYSL